MQTITVVTLTCILVSLILDSIGAFMTVIQVMVMVVVMVVAAVAVVVFRSLVLRHGREKVRAQQSRLGGS